jgi:hypothetical protein
MAAIDVLFGSVVYARRCKLSWLIYECCEAFEKKVSINEHSEMTLFVWLSNLPYKVFLRIGQGLDMLPAS